MLTLRPAQERGHADHGWLRTQHSFSFADYFDPARMGWGVLRVINEDWIAPGRGFAPHGHRDMEIVTYVLSGTLAHTDSMGHAQAIHAGDVQRMSAGRGVRHSEANPSVDEPVHLLQIWVQPTQTGLNPSYAQRHFDAAHQTGRLALLVAPHDAADAAGALGWSADARLYAGRLDGAQTASLDLAAQRLAYVQVVQGQVWANGQRLQAGDGLALADETRLRLERASQAELLVFDLAA